MIKLNEIKAENLIGELMNTPKRIDDESATI
jgi:hypothetical protein